MTTKAEREREARRASFNVLALALFELDGKLTQVARLARAAGAEKVAANAGFWQGEVRGWRDRIREALG